MRVGMRRDQGRSASARYVPEPGGIQMRQVQHDAALVAGPHECQPRFRQTWPDGRATWISEGHARPEAVAPAPDRADRADAEAVIVFKAVEVFADCLSTFEMQRHCQDAIIHATANLRHAPA